MDEAKRMLFEDPTWIYVALAGSFVVLLVVWKFMASRRAVWLLAVPVALAVAVFLVSWLVETDREQILRSIDEIADHANEQRYERIGDYLDSQFTLRDLTVPGVAEAVKYAGQRARGHGFRTVRVTDAAVDVQGRFASADVQTLVETQGGSVPIRWQLTWVKIDDRWLIRAVKDYQVRFAF